MSYDTNKWLEKYEIKRPDYNPIIRESVAMQNVKHKSARFAEGDGKWKSKSILKNMFKKGQATLMLVGDITCFEKQFDAAQCDKQYNFNYEFGAVSSIFHKADLVVGNLETMIAPFAPYRTEKYVSEQNYHCNAPVEFLDAVRRSGIDVVTNANNHDLDTGAVGIGETIDQIERFGLIQTGTFKSEKKRYELIEVNGIKIAIVAFATNHNNKKCNLTPEGIDFMLNDYSKQKAIELNEQARDEKADVVITCIHWGRENKVKQNDEQEKIAKELAEIGYDCIIGSHPHVLQPFEEIKVREKKVPVFYSMGNFISHNINNRKSRSIIACIDLERKEGEVRLECSYIPVYTSCNYHGKRYVVVPICENPSNLENIQRKEQIEKIIGNKIKINQSIRINEYVENKEGMDANKKKSRPNLAMIKEFPIKYDDGKFVYLIYEDYATIASISKDCTTFGYSIVNDVCKVPVTRIENGAFEENQLMKKINFSKNLRLIPENICKNCKNLEGFQLGSNVEQICDEAFAGCINLSAAVIMKKVEKIGAKAFANCENLRTVKLSSNVIQIAEDAFDGCEKAVFYCEEGSYASQYAKNNGFKVTYMELY